MHQDWTSHPRTSFSRGESQQREIGTLAQCFLDRGSPHDADQAAGSIGYRQRVETITVEGIFEHINAIGHVRVGRVTLHD